MDMFEIKRKIACGMDVHKTWNAVCVGITDEHGRITYKKARFSNFKAGYEKLIAFLKQYNCTEVCMESSGVYWMPVYDALEPVTTDLRIAHPKYTKSIKGKKSDPRDAKWICKLYMCDLIDASFIPPCDIRELRSLLRYRMKLVNTRSGEKNRARNCLTVSGIKLDDVFSDILGKSSRAIIDHMLDHPGEHIDVTPLLKKNCKHSAEEIQDAVDGALKPAQAIKLRQCLAHIDELDKMIADIEAVMKQFGESHADSLDLIKTIPGLGNDLAALTVLAEVGDDMSKFEDAKHLTSWAGVCPRPDTSANKVKRSRISKAGTYLKPLLVQVANALVRSKSNQEFVDRYRRLKARHGHQKAIIAICRMLLVALWHVLHDRVPYDPSGFLKERISEHSAAMTRDEAVNLVKRMGIVIIDERVRPPAAS